MNLVIYLIAFLEGFTTLSVEIVALRMFTPVIGSNSISTSIVLGVILLALSYGYYIGGKMSIKKEKKGKRLILNLLFASIYYFFITFLFSSSLLTTLLHYSSSYFLSLLFSSIILFFIPVFLASQTIPLLSELLKGQSSGESIGKLLFYSTIGSFIGSIGTSTFFFPLIGVYRTGVLSSIFLSVCALLVSFFIFKKKAFRILSVLFTLFFIYFNLRFDSYNNGNTIFQNANAYHNIKIYNTKDKRIFLLNGAYSSGIDLRTRKSFFKYIKEAEKKVREIKAKNILVIGAAGFTFPNDISKYDFVKNIDVVDIDSSLKEISEKYFLEDKLSYKIKFYSEPTRFFINQIEYKKYDFILVDAYSGRSLPPQLLTYEFFNKINNISDYIYLNLILDSKLTSNFSRTLLATINKAFGESYYKNVNKSNQSKTNMGVINKDDSNYFKNKIYSEKIYTDNNNSIELDLFKMYKY